MSEHVSDVESTPLEATDDDQLSTHQQLTVSYMENSQIQKAYYGDDTLLLP